MQRKTPRKKRTTAQHTPEWDRMRAYLPAWVIEFAGWPGNTIDATEFDNRVRPFADTDVCMRCKTDAAFEIQERLKRYNKRFVNRDASPYVSRLGAGGDVCTCKRTIWTKR